MRHLSLKQIVLACVPTSILNIIKNKHYINLIRNYKLDSEPDLKVVKYLIDPGDTVIDIGANVGVYTKYLSQFVTKSGLVYSIEPVPQTFKILCNITQKLNLDNVETMNYAMSDSEKTIQMEVPHYTSGLENYYQARVINDNTSSDRFRIIETISTTLDSEFDDVAGKISFVKCDIEGHELKCLRGAKNFLNKTDCVWLIEISGNPDLENTSAHEVFNIMTSYGYTPWWFDGEKLHKRSRADVSVNYFFLRKIHVDKLKKRQPEFF